MAKYESISIDVLKQLLSYDPETGILTWKERTPIFFKVPNRCNSWNIRYANKPAFRQISDGYNHGAVFSMNISAHRVAWALHHGEWPAEHIDHINHIRTDNRIKNLRMVDHTENQRNSKLPKNNKSGILGVSLRKSKTWVAQITINNKMTYLGTFSSKEQAAAVRKQAEIEHGFHPNHGRD